jgi:hypothetical protein
MVGIKDGHLVGDFTLKIMLQKVVPFTEIFDFLFPPKHLVTVLHSVIEISNVAMGVIDSSSLDESPPMHSHAQGICS